MSTAREKIVLAIVLLAFVSLGVYYSVSVPLGEAPDEVSHYQFARFLATTGRLPEGDEAGSEGFQPPLYYTLAALLTAKVPDGDFLIKNNPDFAWGRPETSKSLLMHTAAESFPYRDGVLAWHLMRLLSIAFGTATVVATYAITREVFPGARSLALGAAAVNAFLPGFLFISGSVNNDNAVAALSAWALVVTLRLAKGQSSWRTVTLLGLLVGLAVLAKVSALILLPLGMLALLLAALQPTNWVSRFRFFLSRAVWFVAVAAMISGWWFARNLMIHGDPLGWQFKLGISDTRQTTMGLADYLNLTSGLFTSFWGRFGGAVQLHLPFLLYAGFALISLFVIAGNIAYFRRAKAGLAARPDPKTVLVLAVGAVLFGGSLVQWSMAVLGTDQARLLFPAIALPAICIAIGVCGLLTARHGGLALTTAATALFVLAGLTPSLFIAPAFAAPPPPKNDALEKSIRFDRTVFADSMRLAGLQLPRNAVSPGDSLELELNWQTTKKPAADYRLRIELIDGGGTLIASKVGSPAGGAYATDRWAPGQRLVTNHSFPIPDIVPPGRYNLRLSVLPFGQSTPVSLQMEGRNQVDGQLVIGGVRVGTKGDLIPLADSHELGQSFGRGIGLVSYGLAGGGTAGYSPGQSLRIVLRWQKSDLSLIPRNYTVFVHLVDQNGQLRSQSDGQPQAGRYPTSIWQWGDVMDDEHIVPLPQDLPSGRYDIRVGLYYSFTGARLAVVDRQGESMGDTVFLENIQVK